jgi:phosphate transport system protein
MMGSEHTAKAFDSDLQELTRLVAEMGGLAEKEIAEAVDALVDDLVRQESGGAH